jgi:hypothetical protein
MTQVTVYFGFTPPTGGPYYFQVRLLMYNFSTGLWTQTKWLPAELDVIGPTIDYKLDSVPSDVYCLVAEWQQSLQRQRQVLGLAPDAQLPIARFLAISGGGDNGAFGCGLLVGWTEAGDRPECQVVTGVSTGALIAPFAFLGPAYDKQLHDLYTTISPDDIFTDRGLVGGIFDDAMSDTTPLWNLISKYVDEPLMAAIAREYQKGRLLLIGTTDLDAERANIWNIGAIAASGHPGALDLSARSCARRRRARHLPAGMIDVELDSNFARENASMAARSRRCFSISRASMPKK